MTLDLRPYQVRQYDEARACSVVGCLRSARSRGLCGMHYSRFHRHGDATIVKARRYYGGACAIDGCLKLAAENGMCEMHAVRVRRYGDPKHVTSKEDRVRRLRAAQPTLGKLKPSTYKKFFGRHEHRVVAERKIGRPLAAGEVVHHIDGNKHNNDIANLEVMTQSEHVRLHLPSNLAALKRARGRRA